MQICFGFKNFFFFKHKVHAGQILNFDRYLPKRFETLEIDWNVLKFFQSEIGTPWTKFLESPLLHSINFLFVRKKKNREEEDNAVGATPSWSNRLPTQVPSYGVTPSSSTAISSSFFFFSSSFFYPSPVSVVSLFLFLTFCTLFLCFQSLHIIFTPKKKSLHVTCIGKVERF